MAYATVSGRKHLVRVTRDLTDNYSIEVYPEPPPNAEKISEPYKSWPVPLLMKVMADSKEHALVAGLEHMKKLGKISDFHIEEHEKPKADAPKVERETDDAEEEA